MKRTHAAALKLGLFYTLLAAGIFCWGITLRADGDGALVARGRELFNNKQGLGVKYACILCHQKDKAIKKKKALDAGPKLPELINQYIVNKAKGKPLAKDSPDMQALAAYILQEHSR